MRDTEIRTENYDRQERGEAMELELSGIRRMIEDLDAIKSASICSIPEVEMTRDRLAKNVAKHFVRVAGKLSDLFESR